ncbi:MAG: succinate dehydrogenase cytochrome b subunit [Desulfobulbaceae bacterium]|nr:succinate dehydrogenase cytochrome b subunit [Desulfobulbaceae bacterium]
MTLLSSVGKKSLMALSGMLLGMFLIIHGIGNATTFFGRNAFNTYAEKLHSLGFLIPLFELGLLGVFIVHILLGTTLFFQNFSARPVRYEVDKSSGGRTLGSRTMPYTGVIILIFLCVHLAQFHFIEHSVMVSDLVKTTLQQPLYALFYSTAMIALALHISHGFWSFLQSLGINHPKYDSTFHIGSLIVTIILSGIFILIPLCAMMLTNFLL